jgi:predicted nucleic acid-binding protein
MEQNDINKHQIFHIDANILLDFLWDDNLDEHYLARNLFTKHNVGDIKIKINKFALGEVIRNIIIKNINNYYDDINKLINLFKENKLEIYEMDDPENKGDVTTQLLESIKELYNINKNDSRIGIGDIINLAFFLLDKEATDFKTFDGKIIGSPKLNNHLKKFFGKNISSL